MDIDDYIRKGVSDIRSFEKIYAHFEGLDEEVEIFSGVPL